MEEAGGSEDNIRARLRFRQVEDCAEAHQILGITKHHTGKKIIQPTWRGICYLMLRLEGQPVDRESIRAYQANHLGRFHGNSLLCELMPIPKPRVDEWEYEELIPQFPSLGAYHQVVKPRRIRYLRGLIRERQPRIVVCYGKGPGESCWAAYRELFPHLEFSRDGQFMVARTESTVAVLTPHLASRTMNGKLDRVVSIIRQEWPGGRNEPAIHTADPPSTVGDTVSA